MRTLEHIADDELKHAECIGTYDPQTMKGVSVWGEDVVPPGTVPGKTARKVQSLEIAVIEGDRVELRKVLDRVLAIKGRLPASATRLRESLSSV